MKLPRRTFLHLAVGAAAMSLVPRLARAQAYPTRPVRLIIGYPPGSGPDINARLIGQWLSERLGQPFVIDNRRVPEAISAPRRSCVLLRTVTRSCLLLQ